MNREQIAKNLEDVRGRMAEATRRSGRAEEDVRLVAVTKSVSAAEARILCDLGVRDFGENRVVDAAPKLEAFAGEPVNWHMIGHLQRNKVGKVVGAYRLIHSVDSERLLREIERCAAGRAAATDILLQVNVSGEESKFGLPPREVDRMLDVARGMERVRVAGLMTMAPLSDDPEEARPLFARLRALRDRRADPRDERAPLVHLSMGMTQDFEVAIEEGATLVRVGGALFRGDKG